MMDHLSLVFDPLVPLWLLLALGLASLLVIGFALLRRAGGALWRALFAAALLLILADPAMVSEQRKSLDDIALVVVDRSPSQRIAPRVAQSDAALAALVERLEAQPGTEVRVIEPRGEQRGDGGTRLFGAIRQALGDISRDRLGAVFLVTDGQVHDVPETLDALGIRAPVHLLLTGRENEADRRLVLEQAPAYGIVGRRLSLSVRVEDLSAARPGGTAELRVSQDGKPPRTLQAPVGRPLEVEFELDHRGETVIDLEVEPGPGELSLANNRAAAIVNGVRDRLRVLLVSGEPHAGERAWRNILKSDPAVDLVHFTILRPPEKQDGTPIRELSLIAFPTRELFELKLDEFDLVIFDRYQRRGVLPTLYLENVAAYVENGGALFEAVGPTFATPLSLYRTPLGRVLPGAPTGEVIERGYRPRITDLGQRHPVTAGLGAPMAGGAAPPWGRWFRQIEVDAQRGDVLLDGVAERPLLILERVGEGRVAQLTSDQIWLWSRGFEGGGPQAELVRRVAHWLMKEPDLEEEDLRAVVEGDRLAVTRRSLSPETPPVRVVGPDGAARTLELAPTGPGRAGGSLPVEAPGLYRVDDGTRTALAPAGPANPKEYEDLRTSPAALAPLVTASGGGLLRLSEQPAPGVRKVRPERDRQGDDWLGVLANQAFLVTGIERVPLLPVGLALLLALATLLAAWHREGR